MKLQPTTHLILYIFTFYKNLRFSLIRFLLMSEFISALTYVKYGTNFDMANLFYGLFCRPCPLSQSHEVIYSRLQALRVRHHGTVRGYTGAPYRRIRPWRDLRHTKDQPVAAPHPSRSSASRRARAFDSGVWLWRVSIRSKMPDNRTLRFDHL